MPAVVPPDILAALAHSRYDRRWLDFGVLTKERLCSQAKIPWYRSANDPHTEHNRWDAWSAHLAVHEALSNDQLSNLLVLAEIDPDPSMAVSMLMALLWHPGLTDTQFERVAGNPLLSTHSRAVTQVRLRRRLWRGDWSAELVAQCLEHGDSSVQRMLLDHPKLDRPAVALLSAHGVSKAIRNKATQFLHSRRFRST